LEQKPTGSPWPEHAVVGAYIDSSGDVMVSENVRDGGHSSANS
jgi:hypothetical protein